MKRVWVTKRGDELLVSHMSDIHIINSIKWLADDSEMSDIKDGLSVREWIISFAEELKGRNHD